MAIFLGFVGGVHGFSENFLDLPISVLNFLPCYHVLRISDDFEILGLTKRFASNTSGVLTERGFAVWAAAEFRGRNISEGHFDCACD